MISIENLNSAFWAVELTAFVVIVVMCLLIYAIRNNTLTLKQLTQQLDRGDEENHTERFNGEQAETWFEQGELQNLNRYCEKFIKESPNSVHANWYYALSHFSQGDYHVAREYFENVIRINPLWRDGAVVYLQEIAEKIGLPHSRMLH